MDDPGTFSWGAWIGVFKVPIATSVTSLVARINSRSHLTIKCVAAANFTTVMAGFNFCCSRVISQSLKICMSPTHTWSTVYLLFLWIASIVSTTCCQGVRWGILTKGRAGKLCQYLAPDWLMRLWGKWCGVLVGYIYWSLELEMIDRNEVLWAPMRDWRWGNGAYRWPYIHETGWSSFQYKVVELWLNNRGLEMWTSCGKLALTLNKHSSCSIQFNLICFLLLIGTCVLSSQAVTAGRSKTESHNRGVQRLQQLLGLIDIKFIFTTSLLQQGLWKPLMSLDKLCPLVPVQWDIPWILVLHQWSWDIQLIGTWMSLGHFTSPHQSSGISHKFSMAWMILGHSANECFNILGTIYIL